MIHGGQLAPMRRATKAMAAIPSRAEPATTNISTITYPLLLTSGRLRRRIEAGVTSTSSSSLM